MLLTSLRTAYAEELNLNKVVTSYDDLLDSLRLSLYGYQTKYNCKTGSQKKVGFRYIIVV